MADVKTKPINPLELRQSFLKVKNIYNGSNHDINNLDTFHNINFWFKEETIIELSILKNV